MTEDTVVKFPRHGWAGYYEISNLPARARIGDRVISSGWHELDRALKFYHGQYVVVTGRIGHGKSTFIMNVLVNKARQDHMRAFLYVPENEDALKDVLAQIWGERDPDGLQYFLDNTFVQSSLTEHYDGEPHTIEWVLDCAARSVERDHVEIVVIDPWNELEQARPKDMSMTDYIGHCNRLIKQFCRHFEVIVIMVVHPIKPKDDNMPTLYDCEGSAHWANKADNGIVVWSEKDIANTVRVVSAKVRYRPHAGMAGAFQRFYVDPNSGLFTPIVGVAGNEYDPPAREDYSNRR